jgi:hypothetical protein
MLKLSVFKNPNSELEELLVIPFLGDSVVKAGSLNCALILTAVKAKMIKMYFFINSSKITINFIQ